MRFKNMVPYNMKKLIPMLGLAGATIFTACSKDDDPVPTRDVNVFFQQAGYEDIQVEKIRKIASQPDVRTIYLIPQGDWENLSSLNISNIRKNALQPAIEVSDKVTGCGNFEFKPGVPSEVKEDSLWYTMHNWTINKSLQKQK